MITSNGGSGYSISIVNSYGNSKRVMISKALTKELALDEKLYVVTNVEDSEIYLSNSQISNRSSECRLMGKDKKICYSAALVSLLVDLFKLNYAENKTSLSFSNVSFDDFEDIRVAIVKIDADKCIRESTEEE